jgi:hypothetical protein
VESSCEFGIEPSGSIKCWETIECANNPSSAQLHVVSLLLCRCILKHRHQVAVCDPLHMPTTSIMGKEAPAPSDRMDEHQRCSGQSGEKISCFCWKSSCVSSGQYTGCHVGGGGEPPCPQSASELFRPSDRRLSAKLVPSFCGREQE